MLTWAKDKKKHFSLRAQKNYYLPTTTTLQGWPLRKVVIEGMACQLPSSQEVWRKLLELLLLHSGVYFSVLFLSKKPNYITFCQIDFQIICNLFWSNHFLIRCQTKVLLQWLQVSLKPDCKNWGSVVPILMAADKGSILMPNPVIYKK